MRRKDETTRQRILAVAREKFMTIGYEKTSTRVIAEEVGTTQPNLYHHFKNKQTLYVAVLEDMAIEVEKELTTFVVNDNLTIEETLIEMTVYLRETNPIDIYAMLKDMDLMLSEETKEALYKIFLTRYKQPFIDFFEGIGTQLSEDYDATEISSYYFLTIAPYISPDAEKHHLMNLKEVIHLFLHGVLK
ncbi:TetR/AcrR family transcriptional regulator [Aerococcaceae bacterium 50-4]